MVDLWLGPCSFADAKDAVMRWHYSRRMLRTHCRSTFGVWEDGVFIGVVVFAPGASSMTGKRFGLGNHEAIELMRVALGEHQSPTSKILAIALRLLRKSNPSLRLVLSYADPAVSHHGGIYQATNWIYVGKTAPDNRYIDKTGKEYHSRSVSESGVKICFGRPWIAPKPSECTILKFPGKHKYLLPLDDGMRSLVSPLSKPYPKRAASIVGDAPAAQAG